MQEDIENQEIESEMLFYHRMTATIILFLETKCADYYKNDCLETLDAMLNIGLNVICNMNQKYVIDDIKSQKEAAAELIEDMKKWFSNYFREKEHH